MQIAGRQRLQTAQSRGDDSKEFESYKFFVDETADELVVSIAWGSPVNANPSFELVDPGGNVVTPDYQERSGLNTNEVLKVNKPEPGFWELRVINLFREYFVSATSLTDYEMYLFIGTPLEEMSQGVKVPLLVTFVGPGEPVLGADVTATVRKPNGVLTTITLLDDGNHGDGEADDGIYGGFYTATSDSDPEVPGDVVENEEPAVVGSYLVNAVGIRGDLRREAQGSFALEPGEDANDNNLPDNWEKEYGVTEFRGDDDRDKLLNYCEFELGTDPRNPDTDGGGESDGSEVADPVKCVLGDQDPLDPSDDRVGPIISVSVIRELLRNIPVLIINWGNPVRGELQYVNIFRRTTGNGRAPSNWEPIAGDVSGNEYTDTGVEPGMSYEYLIEPVIDGGGGNVVGSTLTTPATTPAADPYAPGGSILINDGEPSTFDTTVRLSLAADDIYGDEDGGDGGPLPGTATEDLEMRISNSASFEGIDWQPFQAEIAEWQLDHVWPGQPAVVFVQFRDEAGNVSESGLALSDSIVYGPYGSFLPVIIRE